MTGKQLKNSILQWAIQGKLVPQDSNDEPASVLLERIRAEKARLVKEGKIKKDKNESIIFRGEDNSYYEKFADGKVVCIDDEIPFDIPQGWEWARLCHVTSFIEDCPHSTAKDEGNGYALVRTPNIGYGKLVMNGVHRVSEKVYNERNARAIPQTDDLIFAREAPAGNIAIIQEGEKVCLGQRTVLLRPMKQYILPMYLVYYILSPLTQQNLVDKSFGTTVAHVNLSDFRPYLVAIPPIEEQTRIVNIIEDLLPLVHKYGHHEEALSELNNSMPNLIKKSILQEAIQGKLVPQDPNDEPASILLGRIKEEKLRLVKEGRLKKKDIVNTVIFKGDDNKYYEKTGKEIKCIDEEIPFDIPQSWEWSRLGCIIELKSGQDLTPERYTTIEEGIPYITGASNFENKHIKLNRWTTSPTSIAYPGDLLITCKGTVGAMAYNNTCTPLHIARQIMAIHSFIVEIEYIERFLEFGISALEKAAHSIIPGISRETILQAIIPVPPLNEQKKILDSINTLFKSIK